MSEEKKEFSEAQVGDNVWSTSGGDGVIISTTNGSIYPIKVDHGDVNLSYTIDGKHSATDVLPTLFWGKPRIVKQTPPKRKVKKWVNLYRKGQYNLSKGWDYQNETDARAHRDTTNPGFMGTFEIEVEV